MITAWTKNCTSEEDKQKLEASILGSKIALNRLRDLMKEDEFVRPEQPGLSTPA